MRGRRNPQASMLAFVDLEERVPPHHPLRTIKRFADRALATLSPTFDAMYGAGGRPSIPPERLLKASLLISLYSVRSDVAQPRVGEARRQRERQPGGSPSERGGNCGDQGNAEDWRGAEPHGDAAHR